MGRCCPRQQIISIPKTMPSIENILSKISGVAKPQYKFMIALLTALMYLPGKVNFRNLGRYTDLHEKTFSRWFRRKFNFLGFNCFVLEPVLNNSECILATDATHSQKSGHKSYGLDWFWNGSQGRAEKGLELSVLAVVDVTHNTAYALSASQTPALPKAPKKPTRRGETKSQSTIQSGSKTQVQRNETQT